MQKREGRRPKPLTPERLARLKTLGERMDAVAAAAGPLRFSIADEMRRIRDGGSDGHGSRSLSSKE
jgi:hypothetical protein